MLRLKSVPSQDTNPGINLTPMLDVVFLILIFFLLTSIVSTKPVLTIDLPRAEQFKLSDEKAPLNLVIRENGDITINGKPVDSVALETVLSQARAEGFEKPLLIAADKATPFGIFVEVLDMAQKLKFEHLEILSTPGHAP